MSLSRSSNRRTWRSRHARWRSWVASCALLALIWPSLGPLPWIIAAGMPVAMHHDEDGHDGAEAHEHHHQHDASDIPGSPTHPADHDCTPCQMLQHLSRCAPPLFLAPVVASTPACPVLPQVAVQSQRAAHVATLPPVRGPPSRIA